MKRLIVISFCSLILCLALAGDTKHRPPTAKEIMESYSQQAINQMLESLKSAKIAGMIQESLQCPCYDVVVSTTSEGSILRIERDRCVKEEK